MRCGEEITEKSYTRLKYKLHRRMLAPVKYCKFCYLETEDDEYPISPSFIISLTMMAIVVIILLKILT